MKSTAIYRLRQKLAKDEPVYGLWVTLESANVTKIAVALELDWVVIDAESAQLDWRHIQEHIRAAELSETVMLVRAPELNIGLIKRALDIGADGVIVPLVGSIEQIKQAIALAHSLPVGAEETTRLEERFAKPVAEPKENALVIPLIETEQNLLHIQELLDVAGVEIFFFGSADYLLTVGSPDRWEDTEVGEQILAAKDTIRARGKHCGMIAASNKNLIKLKEQGFQMLGTGLDIALLTRSIYEMLSSVFVAEAEVAAQTHKRNEDIIPTFTLENDSATEATVKPLACVPASMRPDRPAAINPVGAGIKGELFPGVIFECLVGSHNQADNLTTGIATFEPAAKLPYQKLPCSESITLLRGQAIVIVEGRMYSLEPLDNVTVPKGIAHCIWNASNQELAVFHLAIPTEHPTRTQVWRFFPRRVMPTDASRQGYPERITRHQTAPRYEAGPNTSFIDFFNRNLIPEIEMSGGYGLFHYHGRLPAHAHDFDESITIIQGIATCVVEGQKHTLSDNATALQPRGRCHYFINERHEPMAMIWVYAGPLPERVVVDERCATVGVMAS